MKKLLATVLCVVLLAGMCVVPGFAYGSEAETLGELLAEFDYTADGLDYEISTWFYQNTNSSFYDLRSDNAEAQLDGTYYAVSDISGVIEILLEDSDSEFEDVYHRDDNGDVTVVEQSEDYYSWGRERILIRTTDGSLPRLIIFLDSSGDSCLFCWETGKGCKLSDGAYDRIKEVLGIDNLSEEDSLTYSYYPLPEGLDEYIEEDGDYNDFVAKLAELDYSIGDGKVTLSWDKTGEETYAVYWKRSSSDEWKLACETSKHKVNIIGLKNGVSYDFKVEILGQDSEVVTATPGEPTYLYAISTVNVRSEPSYEGDRWGTYSCGDKVEVIGYADGWYEINYPYSETSKYVNAAYLSEEVPDGTAEDEPTVDVYTWDYGTFTVTSDTDVYSDVVNGEVVGTLEAGETVEAIGKAYIDDVSLYAYKISYNGEDAYVDKDALSDPDFDVEPNEIDYEDLADRKYSTYDDIGGVEICVVPDSVTSTSATFKIRNSSGYMVTHGEAFRLQVYSDDGWSDVEFIVDSYEVNSIAYLVYGGGNISGFKANWSYFYGELPSGHYRFVLEYTYQTSDGAVNVYGVCGFDIE